MRYPDKISVEFSLSSERDAKKLEVCFKGLILRGVRLKRDRFRSNGGVDYRVCNGIKIYRKYDVECQRFELELERKDYIT